jgi:hypothetical protein
MPCARVAGHEGPCSHHPVLPGGGIDVAALTRAADAMETLSRADELHQMAVAARDAAVAKQRKVFDEKWFLFFKCATCGARREVPDFVITAASIDAVRSVRTSELCGCGSEHAYRTGYGFKGRVVW